jgi:hypothetical protein
VSKLPESFTEVEISDGKKPIQKLRLLFAFFGYPPRKFTMAYPHTVLTAILDPLGECMTPEVARRVIQLRASAEANIRMHLLAGKSAQGTLSEEEREEYESCVSAGTFIAILQAKARKIVGQSGKA